MKIFYLLLVLILSVPGFAWSGSKSPDKGKNQPVKAVDKSASDTVQKASESKKTTPVFVDENGDGINDNVRNIEAQPPQSRVQKKDRFMDEDKDGINDGRGFHRERRRKGGQWNKKGNGGKGRGGPN